jgi:hypothetical protein
MELEIFEHSHQKREKDTGEVVFEMGVSLFGPGWL